MPHLVLSIYHMRGAARPRQPIRSGAALGTATTKLGWKEHGDGSSGTLKHAVGLSLHKVVHK
jgi:hypothetical protein